MKKVCVKCLCLFIVMGFAAGGYAKEPLQPVTVQLNWVPNVEFAGILIAKEKGWYEEAGIDLTIKGWKPGVSSIEDVVSGKVQIGVAEGPEIIEAAAKGQKIKAIAAQFQKSPFCLVSKKEKGLDKPELLKGKKVGIFQQSSLMIKIVLANANLTINDVTPVEVGWDVSPLLTDQIEAYPGYMNNEPLLMKQKGIEVNVISAFKYGYDFYGNICIATDTMIQQQPGMIRNFVDVSLRGWKEAYKDPAGTAKTVVEKYYAEESVQHQTESLKVFNYLATVGIGENLIGYMEEQFWQKGIDILYQFRQIEKKIPAGDVFTLEFLKK
jgi:NitT/TauT family transport system substrate-binding protein